MITGKLFFKISQMGIIFWCLIFANNVSADKYSGSARHSCIKVGKFKQGHCIEVDGHLLYVKSFGLPLNKNHPAVIFLPGSGNTHYIWEKVAPKVAKFSHVVVYDKTGYGYSQQYKKPVPLTASIVVKNLKNLLETIGVSPPYILVGHSHGGIYAQDFRLTYPELVSGMVLVDSSTYKLLQWHRFQNYYPEKDVKLTEPFYYEALGISSSLKSVEEKMLRKANHPFGNLPIFILSAGNEKDLGYFTASMERDWQSFQRQLSKTSNKSVHINVKNSGHFIQIYQPEVIVDAIYDLIKKQP